MNIKSVATKAGVSVATVSRVLNHPDTVAPETREHILRVMESLNYTPNLLARGLKMNRTGIIALLVPDLTDANYMEIAKGVEDVAQQKGNSLMLCATEDDHKKEKTYIQNFAARKVDGLILVSTELTRPEIQEIKEQGIPVVLVGRNAALEGENLVYTDYEAAAGEAVVHLLEIGHKKIGAVAGKRPAVENRDKLSGFQRTMAQAGIPVSDTYVLYEENSIEGGYLAATKMLQNLDRPEAVFLTSDLMAIGFMERIKQEGLRIPEDMAVVGFDNLKISGYLEPKLTTVTQPVYRMGLVAARLLYDVIEDDSDAKDGPQEVFIQSRLKVRKSCGHKDRVREIF